MKASFQKTFDIAQTMLAGVGLEIQESATPLRDIPKDMRKYYKYTHAVVRRSDKAEVATIRMTQSEGLGSFLFMLAGVVRRYGETEGLTDDDMTTLKQKHRGNFCLVSVAPGRYRIEHYMDHARMRNDYDEYAPLVISRITKLA